jgi:hypothetical protein
MADAFRSRLLPHLALDTTPPAPRPPPRRATFVSDFALGDLVHLDDDRTATGRVTGHLWAGMIAYVRISWIGDGDVKRAWFMASRVGMAPQ